LTTGLLAAALLAACGGGSEAPAADPASVSVKSVTETSSSARKASSGSTSTSGTVTTAAVTTVAATASPPRGRLLASGCFNCHGTNGYSNGGFEALAGKSASEILSELKEMASPGETSIMRPHAANYTDAQLQDIAYYFSQQKR
jgi:cytochrome c553